MARETQKQLIEQQEKEIKKLKQIIKDQDASIKKLKKQYKEDLTKAYTETAKLETQMETKEKEYNNHIKELERYYTYKLESKGKTIQKVHNERGAGRKARFTDTEIETIKMYRIQGKTIKEIADMFKCSVGLIHKLISE